MSKQAKLKLPLSEQSFENLRERGMYYGALG